MKEKLNFLKHDLMIMIALLLAGYKYTFGLERVIDIGLYDESYYLLGGVNLLKDGLPYAEGAPLYTVWYFVGSLWQPDRIQLYFLNYKVLTLSLPVAAYILLRRKSVSWLESAVMAFLFLLCYGNLPIWPKVSLLAILVILSFFIIASCFSMLETRLAILLLGALTSSYIRPELFLSFLLLCALSLGVMLLRIQPLLRQKQSRGEQKGPVDEHQHRWTTISILLFTLLTSGILISYMGIPMGSGNRSLVAFGQHFALNWVEWTGSPLSPWLDWEEIIERSFGDVHTIGEALVSNPTLFFRHVGQNLILTPLKLVGLSFIHAPILLPHGGGYVEGYLLLAGIGLLIFIYRARVIQNIQLNLSSDRDNRLFLMAMICVILPGVISAIVISPRSHYLSISSILLPTLAATLLFANQKICAPLSLSKGRSIPVGQVTLTTKSLLVLLLIGIAITPSDPAWSRDTLATPNLHVIKFIQTLDITASAKILEAEGGYHIYLGDNFERVGEEQKTSDFHSFRRQYGINMLVLTDNLRQDARFVNDQEWQSFLENHEKWGYISIAIPNTDRELIVAEELLKQSKP